MKNRDRFDAFGRPTPPPMYLGDFRPKPGMAPLALTVTMLCMMLVMLAVGITIRVLGIPTPQAVALLKGEKTIAKDQARFITGMEPVLMVKEP